MFSVGDDAGLVLRQARTGDHCQSANSNWSRRNVSAEEDNAVKPLVEKKHSCVGYQSVQTVRLAKVLSIEDGKLQLTVNNPDDDYVPCQLNDEIEAVDEIAHNIDICSTGIRFPKFTYYHSRFDSFAKHTACQKMPTCYQDYFARSGWFPFPCETGEANGVTLRCYCCDTGIHITNVEDRSELSDMLLQALFHLGGKDKESSCQFISALLEITPYCDTYCTLYSDDSINLRRIFSRGRACGSDSGCESGCDLSASPSRSSLSSASLESLMMSSSDNPRMADAVYAVGSPDSGVLPFDEDDFPLRSDEEIGSAALCETMTTKPEPKDICILCCENVVNTVALPCGHMFACKVCAIDKHTVTVCGSCKRPGVRIQQTFSAGFSPD